MLWGAICFMDPISLVRGRRPNGSWVRNYDSRGRSTFGCERCCGDLGTLQQGIDPVHAAGHFRCSLEENNVNVLDSLTSSSDLNAIEISEVRWLKRFVLNERPINTITSSKTMNMNYKWTLGSNYIKRLYNWISRQGSNIIERVCKVITY